MSNAQKKVCFFVQYKGKTFKVSDEDTVSKYAENQCLKL